MNDIIHENNSNSVDNVEIVYKKLLPSLRVRTNNVLNAWRQEYQDFTEYIQHFFSASTYEISHLRNCGRQTVGEIINFRERLYQQFGHTVSSEVLPETNVSQEKKQVILPSNIDEFCHFFLRPLTNCHQDRRIGLLNF